MTEKVSDDRPFKHLNDGELFYEVRQLRAQWMDGINERRASASVCRLYLSLYKAALDEVTLRANALTLTGDVS